MIAAFVVAALLAGVSVGAGQSITGEDVLRYPVPDALTFRDGTSVKTAKDWERRRSEILELFAEHVYGRTPKYTTAMRVNSTSSVQVAPEMSIVRRGSALQGRAMRKEMEIRLSKGSEARTIHVLLYEPVGQKDPLPVFVGLNFGGNHTIDADPEISPGEVWWPESSGSNGKRKELQKLVMKRAKEETRGSAASRWQVEKILGRGYALATAYYGDIEPDSAENYSDGIRPLLLHTGKQSPAPDDWGALGAWAWGLSRIADCLKSESAIDGKRMILIGHSRLGKAALWAAAQDKRFSVVISNESGMGGASLYRAKTGETIEHLNTSFPHWFSLNFHEYTGHPEQVPIDGNLLLSLIAPRPLYVASAEQDLSSNPKAEFYSVVLASKVYQLLGKQGVEASEMPAVDHSVMHTIGYHERSGKHDVTAFDWDRYLEFVDRQFKTK